MFIDKKKFNKINKKSQGKKVLVLGDIILDRYLWGKIDRISPEAPVPVVEVEDETYRPGGVLNVSANLVALGLNPITVGIAGKETQWLKPLMNTMSENGIDASYMLWDDKRPTTVKTRIMSQNHQLLRVDREVSHSIDEDIQKNIMNTISAVIDDVSAIIISDYGKGVITEDLVKKIILLSKTNKIFIALDPKKRNFSEYKGVSLITPNLKEALLALNMDDFNDGDLEEAGNNLISSLDLEMCLITLGADGMAVFEKDKEMKTLNTAASEVFDVTGAGDTVISSFTAAIVGGASAVEAAEISNHAAGVVIKEVGTGKTNFLEISKSLFNE